MTTDNDRAGRAVAMFDALDFSEGGGASDGRGWRKGEGAPLRADPERVKMRD